MDLNLRKLGIGGSDIAAVLGLSPWRSPLDVYLDKIGTAKEKEESPAMYWGKVLEDIVAKEWARQSGMTLWRVNKQITHPEHSCLIANIDRAVKLGNKLPYYKGRWQTSAIFEAKTANQYAAADWGPTGSDQIPVAYLAQCIHYLGVTGCEHCHLAVLIGGQDFRMYRVDRDERLISKMQDAAVKFWRDHVEKKTPPPPRNPEDAAKLFNKPVAQECAADADVLDAVEVLKDCKEEFKALEKIEAEAKTQIMAHMGNADTLVSFEGSVLATWKANKNGTRILKLKGEN